MYCEQYHHENPIGNYHKIFSVLSVQHSYGRVLKYRFHYPGLPCGVVCLFNPFVYIFSPFSQPDSAYLQRLETESQVKIMPVLQVATSTQDEFTTTTQDPQLDLMLEYITGCMTPFDGTYDTQESCTFLDNINWKHFEELTEGESICI